MKTNFDYLPPEKQDEIRATVERVAAENKLTPNQRADLEFLLGIGTDVPPSSDQLSTEQS